MNLLIVGAGGLGREIFSWLSHEIKNKSGHKIIGFLDDNLNALDNYSYPVKVIGTIKDYQPKENEKLVLAIMEPTFKKQAAYDLLDKNAKFYNFIHSTAIIGDNTHIGTGCVIGPYCVLYSNVIINDFILINTCSVIGHDSSINSYSSINTQTTIAGSVIIEEGCLIAAGVKIIPQIKIATGCIIGAGSVVTKNMPPNIKAFGIPATVKN